MTVTTEQLELMARLWEQGLTVEEIARKVGVSYGAMKSRIQRHRDMCPLRLSQLTVSQVKRAEIMWRDGSTIREIADETGARYGTIRDYMKNHSAEFPKRNRVTTQAYEAALVTVHDLKAENANLREFASELLPFTGETCPEECRYRAECEGEGNRGSDGLPLMCVAYGHYVERATELGVEVNDA